MKHFITTILSMAVSTAIYAQYSVQANSANTEQVIVWDTYVKKKDGSIMHFDILAPLNVIDTSIIHGYGRQYLKEKGQEGQLLTSKECRRCHIEYVRPAWVADLKEKGYYIIELENCDN